MTEDESRMTAEAAGAPAALEHGLAPRLVLSHRRRAAVTAGVMVALFLAALESTVVATAMPTVVASLGGLAIYSWVFSAYMLASAVSMLLWGRLSDLVGRRPMILAGIALFLTGSALCGLARSMEQLVGFRLLQGLGAGALMPLSLTIVGEIYGLERRAKMQGLFSGVWGIASILGPLVGGVITDNLSWRWVFYVNLPFGLAAMAIIAYSLRGVRAPAQGARLDLLGAGSFTVSLACLLLALVQGGDAWGWTDPPMLALFGGFLALLALFLRQEGRTGNALLPLRLFRDRVVATAVGNGFFVSMAMFGTMAFIPLFVQGVLGTTATGAGQVLIPFTLSWVVSASLGARLLLRLGARAAILAGMLSLSAAFALVSGMNVETDRPEVMAYLGLAGAGMGLVFVTFMVATQTRVRGSELGVSTSLVTFFRSTGATVGVALMGTLMRTRMKTEMAGWSAVGTRIPEAELRQVVENPGLLVDPATRHTFSPEILACFRASLAAAIQPVFLAALVAVLLAFAVALFFPARALPGTGPGRGRPSPGQSARR